MEDNCRDKTLAQLREIAKNNGMTGYYKLKKDDLCKELKKQGFIKNQNNKKRPPSPTTDTKPNPKTKKAKFGIKPPSWDFDAKNEIPESIIPYSYVYGAGSSENDIRRFFILPENFELEAIQYPSAAQNKKTKVFKITYKDFYIDKKKKYTDTDGETLVADIVRIPNINNTHRVNVIAPQINSEAWDGLSQTLNIVDVENPRNFILPQLRREYRIIQTLYSPPF